LLHKPAVTAPIVGATKVGHLEDALAAEEIARLEEPYAPHPVLGHGLTDAIGLTLYLIARRVP
jgi:hypothetical protein